MFIYAYLELLKFSNGHLEIVRDKPFKFKLLITDLSKQHNGKKMGLHAMFEYFFIFPLN